MITYTNSIEIINQHAKYYIPEFEIITITQALNRVIAENIIADTDAPPFSKSAVDGYAFNSIDKNTELKVDGEIAAGDHPVNFIKPGYCIKIFTGAPIPQNADSVVMFEDTISHNNKITIKPNASLKNIIYQGEQFRKNDIILEKNSIITPQNISLIASAGKYLINVYKFPSIGIITTGNEIIEPNEEHNDFKIRNINAYQQILQLNKIGINPKYYGIVKDDIPTLKKYIIEASTENDIVIISGGVSEGDYDYIPKITETSGFKNIIHKIAVKPGKPTLFAFNPVNKKYLFGLPGNPVSSFVIFEFIIKPFIYKTISYDFSHKTILLPINKSIHRKNYNRTEFIPVKIVNNYIETITYTGSSHFASLANADGFIILDENIRHIEKNQMLNVRLL